MAVRFYLLCLIAHFTRAMSTHPSSSTENLATELAKGQPAALPKPASPFDSIRFVLVAPRMAANVGAAARAMKTMGFTQLVLVRPPADGHQATFNFKLEHPDAVALASGALDVLTQARIVNTLDEALSGCEQSVALTARPREWSGAVVQLPEQVARAAATALAVAPEVDANNGSHHAPQIAYVFGNERFGLSNEDVTRCSAICTINVNPDYSSLNLSQAVQVVAYSQRLALVGEHAIAKTHRPTLSRELAAETPATHEQIQGMGQHWLDVLEAVQYFDPAQPRRLKERLGSLWGRANLTAADVDMLRGMAAALGRKL
jgi:tRNA/rRNA methyltransferase